MHTFYTLICVTWSCSVPVRGWSGLAGCFSVRSIRVQETKRKCKGKRYGAGKGVFKYSALILSPPSLHLQSTTQNALLQMGCTPSSPPPHDLLVRIGLCTMLYCSVFANRGYCVWSAINGLLYLRHCFGEHAVGDISLNSVHLISKPLENVWLPVYVRISSFPFFSLWDSND